jgi:ACS family hexuronate transporter-like MFS transporter
MAHGLAGSWQALFGLRALLGFAEGSANPAGIKATSEWFPATERGLAGGFFNMGASLGSMLAAPLVAWAILTHSWQFAFVLTGALGLAWVALWLLFYQSPPKHKALSARSATTSCPARSAPGGRGRPSIGTILGQRNFWGIALRGFSRIPRGAR